MVDSDSALRKLIGAILAGDAPEVSRQLSLEPQLSKAAFHIGASRRDANSYFLDRIQRYIYAGDTALHIAAAAYDTKILQILLTAGADVGARNRSGQQPLHAASNGSPGTVSWNPVAQAATIAVLIDAGTDPNTFDKDGVTPLHKAVRTRCAEAVRTLLALGADPALKNESSSTPMVLATHNTGRGGSGSDEAKAQQEEIIRILAQALETL